MAIDWTKSMIQDFEYYKVDPNTWGDIEKIDYIKSCTITRDISTDTLMSASFDIDASLGECYIRVYLIATQDDVDYKIVLGTFLIQTPGQSFNGLYNSYSIDAYSPLIELKEKLPPLGYTVFGSTLDSGVKTNALERAYNLATTNMRARVVAPNVDDTTTSKQKLETNFTAEADDTWLSFISGLLSTVKYSFELEPNGTVVLAPNQTLDSRNPKWTYTSDNSSILYPDITVDQDLYGIPNEIEVIYSLDSGDTFRTVVRNDSIDSILSTVNRGRVIQQRETDPTFAGTPNLTILQEYANNLLKNSSKIQSEISYTHGYCPITIGDCVMLDCPQAKIDKIKAVVTKQTIKCEPGCPVSETAIFVQNLWR